MDRRCLQCNGPLPPTRRERGRIASGNHQHYCSDTCLDLARTWVCKGCGTLDKAHKPSRKRTYCAKCVGRQENTVARTVFQKTRDRQIAQGRVLVACNYDKCPRPGDLLDLTRSESQRPSRCRHPECKAALREERHGGCSPLTGREIFCADCGESRGYRPPYYERKFKFCRVCAQRMREANTLPTQTVETAAPLVADGQAHALKEWRTCGLDGCESGRLVWISEIKKYPDRTFYCSWAHVKAAQAARTQHIHCRGCTQERVLERAHIPRAFDPETMTYLCQACWPVRSVVQTFDCHRAGCSIRFERRVLVSALDVPRFCSRTCRVLHYDGGRAVCANPRCYNPIPRRKRYNRYCSTSCYEASKPGRPTPHRQPSKAEGLVVAQIESGVRRIKVIVDRTGVARNTVRRVFRERGIVAGPHALT